MAIYDEEILAAFGQLNRDEDFRIITKILSRNSQIYVRKEAYSRKSIPHVERLVTNHKKLDSALSSLKKTRMVRLLTSGDGFVEFEYINGRGVEYEAFKLILSANYGEVIELIDRIFILIENLSSQRGNNETDTVKKINNVYDLPSTSKKYTSPGIIDLNLDNFILDLEDELVAFDYEWTFDQPIATDYIKTRLLYTFFARRSEAFAFLPSTIKTFKTIWEGEAQTLIPTKIFTRYSKLLTKESMKKYWEAEDIFQKSINCHRIDTAATNYKSFISEELSTPSLTYPEYEEIQRDKYKSLNQSLVERTKYLEDELELIKSSTTYKVAKKMSSAKGKIIKKRS